MSISRIRVQAKYVGRTPEEIESNNKKLCDVFTRLYNESGIAARYKECQYYESKGEKRRKKKKEKEHLKYNEKLKDRLRRNFG